MSKELNDKSIDALKKVKIPFWVDWIGAYRARQRRKNAHKEINYVATVYAWTYWSDVKSYSYQWYICKVDGTGRRFYEYGTNHPLLKDKEKSIAVYASIIAPWVYKSYSHQQLIDYAERSAKQPEKTDQ